MCVCGVCVRVRAWIIMRHAPARFSKFFEYVPPSSLFLVAKPLTVVVCACNTSLFLSLFRLSQFPFAASASPFLFSLHVIVGATPSLSPLIVCESILHLWMIYSSQVSR